MRVMEEPLARLRFHQEDTNTQRWAETDLLLGRVSHASSSVFMQKHYYATLSTSH